MSKHFSKEQAENYLRRSMTAAELLAADDHLAQCPSCREHVLSAKGPAQVVGKLRADFRAEGRQKPNHLDYEQLEAYVDDRMDDVEREIADNHLYVCARCKEELRDLFAFKETLAGAPLVESGGRAAQAPTLLEKIRASIANVFGRSPFQLAGGLAALALVALGVTLWFVWRASQDRPRGQEIVKVQPTPVVMETPVPAPTGQPSQTPPPPAPVQSNTNTSNTTGNTTPVLEPPVNRAPVIKQPPPQQNTQGDVVAALNDGGRKVTLDRGGRVEGLDALSPAEREAVRAALQTGRAAASAAVADLRGSSGTLMGDTAPGAGSVSFDLQSPVGTVVRTGTPTLRWKAPEGATAYRVDVFDSSFNKVSTSGTISQTEWRVPRSLPRGRVYSWQVTATVDGKEIRSPAPTAPEARFRVLEGAQSESLERAEKSYADSHLALGVLYARAGLLDEAEREFRALLKENPDSTLAQKLLRNIETLRGPK
jgi:hypothetical protein